jgi:hypothetical protein
MSLWKEYELTIQRNVKLPRWANFCIRIHLCNKINITSFMHTYQIIANRTQEFHVVITLAT